MTTTPVAGNEEYDGTNKYFTNGTATRYVWAKILVGSAVINFPSTAAGDYQVATITVTGAADGDPVSFGVPNGSVPVSTACNFSAWVSAANTVTIKFINHSGGALDPGSGTFKAYVTKY